LITSHRTEATRNYSGIKRIIRHSAKDVMIEKQQQKTAARRARQQVAAGGRGSIFSELALS
jgi:hypothetical protein